VSEELVDGIAWTAWLRGEVIPSRRFPNPAHRAKLLKNLGALDYPLDRDHCFRNFVAYGRQDACQRQRARAIAGLASNPPAWRAAVEQAIENAAHPEARGPFDVDAEAAAVTLELYPLWVALSYWLAEAGIVFALRALVRCHDVSPLVRESDPGHTNYLVDRPDDRRGLVTHDRWELLRCMLADAIEPTYDEAHGIADRARIRAADPEAQLLIAFAFPDEHAWARDAAPAALALARKRRGVFALANYLTVAPIETAVKIVDRSPSWMVTSRIATLLAHHGVETTPVLSKLLARAGSDSQRSNLCDYVLAIRTVEATRALDRLAKRARSARAQRLFARYAKKHRMLMAQSP
jgi:hypothetical protein